MKDNQPQQGDSLVVLQNGNYFSGTVLGNEDESTGAKKQLYQIVVTAVYPDLNSGKVSDKIKSGDKVTISPSQIRHVHTEMVNNIMPDLCLTVENGMVTFAKRTDGKEEDMIIKIVDEDDGTTKMFIANAHSFTQMCDSINESPALI